MSIHILPFTTWGYYNFTNSRSLYLGRVLLKLRR